MRTVRELNMKDLLIIDIETVRLEKELQLDTPLFDSWAYKMQYELWDASNDDLIAAYKDKAALHPEFAKIACISMGYVKGDELVLKTYNNPDEKVLLEEFNEDLELFTTKNKRIKLAGHYIIYFDIPFIMKRCMVNQVLPHDLIDTSGQKPWETTTVDTKDIWRANSPTPSSLINIAVALGLPSPKDDISGAQVGDVYWGDLPSPDPIGRISAYCEKDVLTVANVIRRLRFEDVLRPSSKLGGGDNTTLPIIEHLANGGRYTVVHKNQLIESLNGMTEDEREKAFVLLQAMISTAKGKTTKFTKDHLKELKELCVQD